MRRMMHAMTVSLLLTNYAAAQDLPGVPAQEPPAAVQATPAEVPMQNVPIEFYPIGGEQPYSQLATYMSCHDNCKDFWAGYSAERAAIAARLCKECKHGNRHGCPSCNSACGSTACGTGGCGSGVGSACDGHASVQPVKSEAVAANRYRSSWSTLYRTPAATSLLTKDNVRGEVSIVKKSMPSPTHPASSGMSVVVSGQPNTVKSLGDVNGTSVQSAQNSGDQSVVSPYLKSSSGLPFAVPVGVQTAVPQTLP